ncbi:MAG: ABC transporter permease [Alphaproteobacteria bacterium]|nr:ABC transporter permease [Alphaproteobacteria bacterium]
MNPIPPAIALNQTMLAAGARRERAALGMLTLPTVLLIGAVLVVPFGWLAVLSVLDNGQFSLVHYQRIADPAFVVTLRITLEMAAMTTFFCGIIGYPLAYFMLLLPRRWAAFAGFCVLVPFWTAILVRTYAWVVLLQRRGIINSALIDLGIIDEPLSIAFNLTGTIIGLTHIFLPFLVLPLYAAMRSIPFHLTRAAASLGASRVRAFWTVFFPLSLPGFVGGLVMVFVLCLGSYVTPTILGGGRVIVWPMRVADAVNLYANWGVAAALGVVLLAATYVLVGLVGRGLRIDLLSGERR